MYAEKIASQHNQEHFCLFDIDVDNISMSQSIDWIVDHSKQDRISVVSFVNAHNLNQVCEKMDYKESIQHSDLILPDGSGVKLASMINGVALKENINGTDMLPFLCDAMSEESIPVFLLGAKPGVAIAMAKKLEAEYKNLNVVGCAHGYFEENKTGQVINQINRSGAKVLLVAMGTPAQEIWIDRHKSLLMPNVIIGVGGLFDFYSGRIPRAPKYLRRIGCEWVWRLIQEPSRMWRRYILGNPLFIARVLLAIGNRRSQ